MRIEQIARAVYYDLMTYDHSLFWRTRRAMSAGGFLTTIHNITDVAAARAYLYIMLEYHCTPYLSVEGNIPSKNILRMIIPQIHLRRPSDWYSPRFPIPRLQQIRLHRLFNPHSLRPNQLRHLHHIGKIKLVFLGRILRRKHVLLPWLSQQALHRDFSRKNPIRTFLLVFEFLGDPAAVHEHRCAGAVALEGSDDEIALVAFVHAGSDEHLLVVSEVACCVDAAVVEVMDGCGVDVWWEGKRITHETVFEFSDEFGFPVESLHLPCSEGEGCDGYQSYELRLADGYRSIVEGPRNRIPSIIRPGPCRLPARTRLGGLSTMDMKFGSSAG